VPLVQSRAEVAPDSSAAAAVAGVSWTSPADDGEVCVCAGRGRVAKPDAAQGDAAAARREAAEAQQAVRDLDRFDPAARPVRGPRPASARPALTALPARPVPRAAAAPVAVSAAARKPLAAKPAAAPAAAAAAVPRRTAVAAPAPSAAAGRAVPVARPSAAAVAAAARPSVGAAAPAAARPSVAGRTPAPAAPTRR
jgi:hypothetical protein